MMSSGGNICLTQRCEDTYSALISPKGSDIFASKNARRRRLWEMHERHEIRYTAVGSVLSLMQLHKQSSLFFCFPECIGCWVYCLFLKFPIVLLYMSPINQYQNRNGNESCCVGILNSITVCSFLENDFKKIVLMNHPVLNTGWVPMLHPASAHFIFMIPPWMYNKKDATRAATPSLLACFKGKHVNICSQRSTRCFMKTSMWYMLLKLNRASSRVK